VEVNKYTGFMKQDWQKQENSASLTKLKREGWYQKHKEEKGTTRDRERKRMQEKEKCPINKGGN
jgi:hypothetical protein